MSLKVSYFLFHRPFLTKILFDENSLRKYVSALSSLVTCIGVNFLDVMDVWNNLNWTAVKDENGRPRAKLDGHPRQSGRSRAIVAGLLSQTKRL